MSWHFLQEQAAAFWERDSLDGAPSALLKLMPNAELRYLPDSETASSNDSPYGTTSKLSTADDGAGSSMSSLEDSRVRTSAQPAQVKDSPESAADCGWKWRGSFVKYDPVAHGWKIRQLSLFEDSESFSPTWPRWGSMQGGECFPLAMLEHDTSVKGSLSLPTVTASWDRRGPGLSNNFDNLRMSRSATEQTLKLVDHFGWRWPTPVLEWMMMWPEGWSALTPLAMDKFHAWLQAHGAHSSATDHL